MPNQNASGYNRPIHHLFSIYVPQIDETYVPMMSRARIRPELAKVQAAFAEYLAYQLKYELQRAIERQRYWYDWTPLNHKYLQRKLKAGLSLNTWEATSFLKENITYWKNGRSYVVGVRPNLMHPRAYGGAISAGGANQRLSVIAKTLEFGSPSKNIPPRPLFRPLLEYFRKNMGRYLEKFLREYYPDLSRSPVRRR